MPLVEAVVGGENQGERLIKHVSAPVEHWRRHTHAKAEVEDSKQNRAKQTKVQAHLLEEEQLKRSNARP